MPDRLLATLLALCAVLMGLIFLNVLLTKVTALSWVAIMALVIYGATALSSGLAAKRLWRRTTVDRRV